MDVRAWKERVGLWEVQCDVPSRVTRRVIDVHAQAAKLPGVTLCQTDVNAWYAVLVCSRPNNDCPKLRLQL
jgi:hypothetical protein